MGGGEGGREYIAYNIESAGVKMFLHTGLVLYWSMTVPEHDSTSHLDTASQTE